MGRLFIQYCEDDTASRYTCLNCGVDVASNSAVIWSGHMGMQKPAFLLRGTTGNVVPISKPRQERLHTGLYTLQTLGCRCCAAELGWLYVSCHGHAEHLYKQGCSLLEQAALRASPSRLSLANARQELRKMQHGQRRMLSAAHRSARHLEGSSAVDSISSRVLLGAALQRLHRSGNPPPVSTTGAPFSLGWNERLEALRSETDRLLALRGDAMQEDEERPGGLDTEGRGLEGGDAGARGTAPVSLEDARRQLQQQQAFFETLQQRRASGGGPRAGGQVPPTPLGAAEHLARNWIGGRTQLPSPPRPILQHMLSLHLEALERAPSGSSPAAVAARQAALTDMNQALNAMHNHEQHIQHEMEAIAHSHRGGLHAPEPMSEQQEGGMDDHDDEELPEAAVVQATTRGAPPVGVHRRLFPEGESDAEAMSGDQDEEEEEEEEEEGNQQMEEGDVGEIEHLGVVAMDPGQQGGGEGEEDEEVDEDLGFVDVEQQRDEAAGSVTLGEAQQSQARLEEQLMIDAFMEGMGQDQDSDLDRALRTASGSHHTGGTPSQVPPPPWLAGGGLMSRQAQQHRLDHHLAERQLAPPQRVPGYRMPPFLTRSLRRNGGPSGSEARIAWPATAASERRREIGDGGREGMRGVEAPGAGAEPIPCLPRSIQPPRLPLPVTSLLDRQRCPL
ncbi:hypothetical protein DUNSADRAFT_5030 [Dunaliella salina]|uniref:Yippee domain-containing protein n=1 Tax=Dunaliella salina TaxID=3046 RepID=A0ABQ7HAB1_DUNSA|nr:hypothetical protein DUNSADRAFT_5030 [Dunaliella salina]|eukprot:KAF5843793.1 hypothetical protein DUNSADRAFT_5030 [Dunaliella salina]